MSRPPENRLPGYFRLFQTATGGFVDMHETHGKLESRQNIPIALFLAIRGEQVRLLPVLDLRGIKKRPPVMDWNGSLKCRGGALPMPSITPYVLPIGKRPAC